MFSSRWLPLGFLLALIPCLSPAEEAGEEAWQPLFQAEDFAVYRKPSAASEDLFAFRGIGTLEATPVEVATAILDRARRPEWMRDIRDLRLVRIPSPGSVVEYSGVKTPFVVKDRDFVIRTDVAVDWPANRITIVSRSVVEASVPPTSAVRGELTQGRFGIEPGPRPGTARLTADRDVDPKGSCPRWIVNHFQKNWPVGMFRSLKYFLARKVATLPEDLRGVLTPPAPSS